ncbi:MAG TPA: hypothetical protein VEM41_10235 [Actinomycetota bacterium]|nr:hypothetical protein [Actinomycetota bacterium]
MSDVRDLRPYEELREALDARADTVWPSRDALYRVRTTALHRRRRRRVAIGSCALVATTVAFASVGGSLREAKGPERSAVSSPASRARAGTEGAAALRTLYGIVGTTKGAAAPARSLPEAASIAGQRQTGGGDVSIPGDAASTSVAPGHTTVAVVTKQQQVVVESTVPGASRTVLGRTRSGAQVSWAPGGTALFAFVGRHWVRVPSADGTSDPIAHARALSVPRVPGGPSFISLSPEKDAVVLFGLTRAHGGANRGAIPHAYIARFDGSRVTHVRRIRVPAAATRGPLGWLGDNAFVVAAGPGMAWIVRVHGSPVAVRTSIPDVCALTGAPSPCTAGAPRLLGTDAAGALLFWEVRVNSPAAPVDGSASVDQRNAATQQASVAYFSTWLDGSNPARLTGSAGTYGPTLAAR